MKLIWFIVVNFYFCIKRYLFIVNILNIILYLFLVEFFFYENLNVNCIVIYMYMWK